MAVKIDGTKVRFWSSKAQAREAARSIGWPISCVCQVETRFQVGYALGMGVDVDPVGGAFLSRQSFGELYHKRNDDKQRQEQSA